MPVSSAPHDKASDNGDTHSAVASNGGGAAPQLRLYVAGVAPNSVRARANLGAIMERYSIPADALEVVDCLREPRRALADAVLVTPTLLKVGPEPRQVIVGSLTDTPRVLSALGLGGRAAEDAPRAP